MYTVTLLMTIFVSSFILAFVISYFIVKNEDKLKYGKLHDKKLTIALFINRSKLAIKNFILISILTTISMYAIGDNFFVFEKIAVWKFAFLFFVMIALDDVWFYFIHRMMHTNKYLYKKIHSVHHTTIPPIPLDYLFVHPLEALVGSIGLIIGVLFLFLIDGNINFYVVAAYSLYRALHEIAIHSGFQIIPKKYLGFIGGAKHHFNHHKFHNGNYASAFTYLDKLFGTEVKVRGKVID